MLTDLDREAAEQSVDVDIETGLETLESAEHVDEGRTRVLGPRNGVGKHCGVVAPESSTAEWAAAGSVGVGTDLRQQERPTAGVALRLDPHAHLSDGGRDRGDDMRWAPRAATNAIAKDGTEALSHSHRTESGVPMIPVTPSTHPAGPVGAIQ